QRQAFDAILLKESAVLSERLETLAAELRAEPGSPWPMADIYGEDLLNCLARRLGDSAAKIKLTVTGAPLWLHGDSLSLMLVTERLVRELHARHGIDEFDAELLLGDRRVYLDIGWRGQPIAAKELDGWIDERLEELPGGLNMRDILERHGSEIWSQAGRHPDSAVIRIPLIPPLRGQFSPPGERLPPRPEFYDFSLMRGHSGDLELSRRRLDELTFVVFDTETTGLDPERGDEIVSIAGVRVVKGRVLTGETFERLVNPGRPIPAASTRFHGLTDALVAAKPPIQVVLPQFMEFCGDAVIVAHNAPFDLKFLHLHEAEANVSIRNAALDTLLLSALLDPQEEDHSLDTLLERYDVRLAGRHTALGDAMATAEILVRMIARLRDRGLATFGDVQAAASPLARLRREAVPEATARTGRAGGNK
ncbi:MAG: 3'-5' exonuclease, partial [Alphaproteobacteria bacterium]|nr:3'-5' exonuclease [Alphaproteobacteria bacterium]